MKPIVYYRNPVKPSSELTRIVNLPRRPQEDLSSARGLALAQLMTRKLSINTECRCEEKCIKELKPVQGWALYEMQTIGGLFGALGVGSGKTTLGILAPLVVPEVKLAVLFIPPTLKEQLWKEYYALRRHFRVPSLIVDDKGEIVKGAPVLQCVPYSMFSRKDATDYLERLQPDLIIADECHRFKHKSSASTSRFIRYMAKHPETRFAGWSGTITNKSIKDYAHLLTFALDVRAPIPQDNPTLEEWALAIDPSDNPAQPGALTALCQDGESIQQGYYRRFSETRGVVATKSSAIDASMSLLERTIKVPHEVDTLLKSLRSSWTRPDGEELVSALDVSNVASQLAAGFYYRWRFPRKEPHELIDEWFKIRQAWNKELREKLKNRSEHLDSPLLCENAAARALASYEGDLPIWHSDHFAEWSRIKKQVYHETEAVWVSDFLAHDAAEYARKHKVVVWYEHNAFGDKVAQLANLPKHGGGPNAEREILAEKGDRSIIASIPSHGTGRDGLQKLFVEQLVTTPPTSGQTWEQLLGRLHRHGQTADEITTHVYRHTKEYKEALDTATLQAQYIQDTLGTQQKLLLAARDF
jgi:hypothetical protein